MKWKEGSKHMINLLKTQSHAAFSLAGTLLLAGTAAWAQGVMAHPGSVNFTEGQIFVNGQAMRASETAQVQPGQTLETRNGRAEMLLTPGVFLRLDNNSQARLESNSITDTRIDLLKGGAMIEAAQVEKDNGIRIVDAGYNTLIDKRGIYEFNADQPMVRVYDGEVTVHGGDRSTDVKKGHELALVATNTKLKTQGFDTKNTDALYSWSKLRSEYMAEANMATAQTIVVNNPGWFYGTGWYWNPYYSSWAFVPGAGYWGSPFGFGFGFYSPAYWSYYRPWIGGYRGVVRPGFVRSAPAFRGGAPVFRGGAPAFRGGFGGAAHFGGGRR
jgi:FecR protein